MKILKSEEKPQLLSMTTRKQHFVKIVTTHILLSKTPHSLQYIHTLQSKYLNHISQHSNTKVEEKRKESDITLKCF